MPDLKVTADHLRRDAYLYIRQSTLWQVAENGESTQRQYALRHRAIAVGWPTEHIRVIDCDLGKSGSSSLARDGFQELVSEVALAKAGIVMGLEVSRLARNSADWHRLPELCALTSTLTSTLILDEDGVCDPASFNDRLLLGLKGTMSEAELHFLKARMRGGQLNKASRGELKIGPPVGLVYLSDDTLALDPDAEVQAALRMVFATFGRLGSATRTVRFFPRRRYPVSAAIAQGTAQRRAAMGAAAARPHPPDTAQSEICWRLRLRSNAGTTATGRQRLADQGDYGRLAGRRAPHAPGLY